MNNINGKLIESSNVSSNISGGANISGSLSDTKLHGKISGSTNISGSLSNNSNIRSNLQNDNSINANLMTGTSTTFLDYGGSYDIIPNQENQTLQTKNKILRNNMLVEKIPYFETSNEYGYTAYIGSEVEINGN